MTQGALANYRICDFTGQLAGAGATKWMASFGAEIIRIEDPVRQGRWDILRGIEPFIDERRGVDMGGGFNNHNTDKFGITLNLRSDRAKEILRELIAVSDAVTENFAAGVLASWGFDYAALKAIKPDIVYVSNCGFGHSGPYRNFKTWGPVVQAVSGLTFRSALPGQPPAGWGYSYMDHTGGYYMAMAVMLALIHRERTGEGQWVDLACTEAALTLHGPALLDWSVNGRATRREPAPSSNHSEWPAMAPHGIFPCRGEDAWIAIACRDDADWRSLGQVAAQPWCQEDRWASTAARIADQQALDDHVAAWTADQDKFELTDALTRVGIAAAPVQTPEERIERDPSTAGFGLWPTVTHSKMGEVRVDGQPVHFSATDWRMARGGPCLGEHTEEVLTRVLGMSADEVATLRSEGVV